MFVNLSAATRILSAKYETAVRVIKIWSMRNNVGVLFMLNGKKVSSIIAGKAFLKDALTIRAEKAKEIKPVYVGNGGYIVESGDKTYYTSLKRNEVACDCVDFDEQKKRGNGFTKPVCKHILAIMQSLGTSNLKDAMNKIEIKVAREQLELISV